MQIEIYPAPAIPQALFRFLFVCLAWVGIGTAFSGRLSAAEIENLPNSEEAAPASESSGSQQTFSVGLGWTHEQQRAMDLGLVATRSSRATKNIANPYLSAHASWHGQWQWTHWGFVFNPVVISISPLSANRISKSTLTLNAFYLTYALDESHPLPESHGLTLGLVNVCEDQPKAIFGCYLEGSGAYFESASGHYSSAYAGLGSSHLSKAYDWTDSLSGTQFQFPMLRLRTGKPHSFIHTEWALVLEEKGDDVQYNYSAWARIALKASSELKAELGLKAYRFRSQLSTTNTVEYHKTYSDTSDTSKIPSYIEVDTLSSVRFYYRPKQTWIPTATLALSLDSLMRNRFGHSSPWFSQTGFFIEAALLGIYDLPPYFTSTWQRTVLLFGADLPSRAWLQTFRGEFEAYANREGMSFSGGNWRAGLLLVKSLGHGFSFRGRIQYGRHRPRSFFSSLEEVYDRTIPIPGPIGGPTGQATTSAAASADDTPIENQFRADMRLIWRMGF